MVESSAEGVGSPTGGDAERGVLLAAGKGGVRQGPARVAVGYWSKPPSFSRVPLGRLPRRFLLLLIEMSAPTGCGSRNGRVSPTARLDVSAGGEFQPPGSIDSLIVDDQWLAGIRQSDRWTYAAPKQEYRVLRRVLGW
jgi:hypothetical protein